MTSSAGWHVRPWREGDEVGATQLFHEVFHHPMSTATYRWKLVGSPWPIDAQNIWVAHHGDRIVGQYAGTPMRFKLGGEIVPILHGCDVMTAPQFRRQGVLTALGTAATQAWRQAGVAFVTGLHYGGWGTRRHQLGWREQFTVRWIARPLRLDRLCARLVPLPRVGRQIASVAGDIMGAAGEFPLRRRAAGIEVIGVDRPGPEFDVLWDRIKHEYEALVVRDRAWITYRYLQSPWRRYEILLARRADQPTGYLVSTVLGEGDRTSGAIVDLFTGRHDTGTRAALLLEAFSHLRTLGAGFVRTFCPKGTGRMRELARAGFLRSRGSYDISIVPLAVEYPHPVLGDPNRWFTMPGDYDVL